MIRNCLRSFRYAILPVILRFLWIMIITYNCMLFINNTVAFAISMNANFLTLTLENSALMSVGIVGLISNLKNKKEEREVFYLEN